METYRYTVHRTGFKQALVRGRIKTASLEKAIKRLQRHIKKTVLKQKLAVYVRVWNIEDETERFERQYMTKRDFTLFKKVPKWRQTLSKKARRPTYDPTPTAWFVAVGKRGQIDITKFAYEPTKQSLLRKKRKRLFGPFEDEARAQTFVTHVQTRLDQRETQFSQKRRYKGPIEDPS